MEFVVSKLVGAVVAPLSLVAIGLVLGLLLAGLTRFRRFGLGVITLATAGLLVSAYLPTAERLLAPLERAYPPPTEEELRAHPPHWILILGSGHYVDPDLPITSQLTDTGVVRLSEGLRRARQFPQATVVVSGGAWAGEQPHSEFAARFLMEMGVAPERIRQLTTPRNTRQEAEVAASLMGDDPVLLVTSASHMRRAMHLFRTHGVNATAAPTHHWVIDRTEYAARDYTPRAEHLLKTERALHEHLGILWEAVR